MLTVQCIKDPSQWFSTREVWEPLAGGVPMRTWAWMGNWWQAFGTEHQLCVLAVRDPGQRIIGLLPLYRERGAQGRALRAVGDGSACTDYFGLLCQREDTSAVANAIAQWLVDAAGTDNSWDHIDLQGVVGNDRRVGALVAALEARGAAALAISRINVWRLHVGSTREEFLKKLSKNHRKQLKKLERRVAEYGDVLVRRASSPAEIDQGLDRLGALHRQRWEATSVFHERRFGQCLSAACHAFHAAGRLVFLWVERAGRPLAMDLHFRGDRGLFGYLTGMDPEARDLQPGRILNLEAVKIAQEEGLEFVDFLRGDEPYKAQWRADSTPLVRLRICPPAFPRRLKAVGWETEVRLKNWARAKIGRSPERIVRVGRSRQADLSSDPLA